MKILTKALVFRYHHTYPRAIALLASGILDIKHLITDKYDFADALKAFDKVADRNSGALKVQIMN